MAAVFMDYGDSHGGSGNIGDYFETVLINQVRRIAHDINQNAKVMNPW
jgi:hypothetical protein